MTTEQIAVSKRISNNGTVSFDFDHGDYHVRVRFRVYKVRGRYSPSTNTGRAGPTWISSLTTSSTRTIQ